MTRVSTTPADLARRIEELLREEPRRAWDEALSHLVARCRDAALHPGMLMTMPNTKHTDSDDPNGDELKNVLVAITLAASDVERGVATATELIEAEPTLRLKGDVDGLAEMFADLAERLLDFRLLLRARKARTPAPVIEPPAPALSAPPALRLLPGGGEGRARHEDDGEPGGDNDDGPVAA